MPIIGLDLGSHSFRAVELERKKNESTLLKFGEYENPKLNFRSDSKDDINAYVGALKGFFTEIGFDTPNVVVSLDESHVYMKTIKVPKMSDKDLKNSINFEAEHEIPLPLSEVTLSYQKMDIDMEKGKMNVQLVAAKKAVLDRYVDITKKAKLVPRAIEPETLALGRVLGDSVSSPMGTIIVDIGYSNTLIIIVYGGFVRFTRSVLVGGDVITRAIQQGLSLDYAQADEYKKVYGMDPQQVEGKIFETAKPIMDNIITEVKRAAIFFTKKTSNVLMKRVILVGGTAQMPGLLSYMANNLDLEVELANPFKNISISDKLEGNKKMLLEKGPTYAAAVGLALKEV